MASEAKSVLSLVATTSQRVRELPVKDGQLIFVRDKCRLAFDFKGKRTFYNQITELDAEYNRVSMQNPEYGYYFVIETAVLWFYDSEWVQITGIPEDIVFIGTELPALGKEKTIYIDKNKKEISVWDNSLNDYIVVADKTDESQVVEANVDSISFDDIDMLF